MLIRTLLTFLVVTIFATTPASAKNKNILGHETFGTGAEKIIVLHDWMGDSKNYDTARPWLDPTSFTYAFADVRGYGKSRHINGKYTSDEVASDVMRLADHLGWKRFHLVGHSMNGMAGFKAILTDWKGKRRIKSYVAATPVTPDGYPASKQDKAFLTKAISDDKTAMAAFGALTGGKLNANWASAKTARNRMTSTPKVLTGYYNMWIGEDFSSALAKAKIAVPVLVIGGRNDLPGFQEVHYKKILAKWLPAVKFAYIDNAGHYPMQETPVLFATLIEAHFSASK